MKPKKILKLVKRLYRQNQEKKGKVYINRAPEVECIVKEGIVFIGRSASSPIGFAEQKGITDEIETKYPGNQTRIGFMLGI